MGCYTKTHPVRACFCMGEIFRMTTDYSHYDMRIIDKAILISINAVVSKDDLQEIQDKETARYQSMHHANEWPALALR